MKTRLAVLLTGLACLLAVSISSRAAVDVSFSAGIEINSPNDFYEPLTPWGEWVAVGSYGRCWHPIQVGVGWRPYVVGHWEWTDVGWYWVSDEPWAWACYHYGSWVDDPRYGWCWIPATEWAPSWVVWRESPEYIGWAPFGPGGAVLAPSLFVFVDIHRFHEPIRANTVIVNNTTIINRTRVINDIRRVDRDFDGSRRRVVINEGPRVDAIAKTTGRTFTPRPIREVVRQTPVPERIRRTGTMERPVLQEQNVRNRHSIEQQQGERTAPPTGREQPRTYPGQQQRPDQARPEQRPPPSMPEHRDQTQPQQPDRVTPNRPVPPTGREEPRVTPQPEQRPSTQKPEQNRPEQRPAPNAPDRREQERPSQVTPERPVPPTGREEPRVTPQPQNRSSTPQSPDQIRPERPSQATPERPTPPTGRSEPRVLPGQQQPREIPQRPEQVRPERPAPQVPPERVPPPTGREVPREQPQREQPAVREQPKEVPQPQQRPVTPPAQEKKDRPDGQ